MNSQIVCPNSVWVKSSILSNPKLPDLYVCEQLGIENDVSSSKFYKHLEGCMDPTKSAGQPKPLLADREKE